MAECIAVTGCRRVALRALDAVSVHPPLARLGEQLAPTSDPVTCRRGFLRQPDRQVGHVAHHPLEVRAA